MKRGYLFIRETQVSEAERTEICKSNNPDFSRRVQYPAVYCGICFQSLLWVFIPVIMVLGFFSCAKEIVITENDIKPDIFYTPQGLKPFSGVCKIYYTHTDLVKEEFRFKNGRLHGASYSYYPNGNLVWKGSYQNGMMSGKWQKWDDDGNLIVEVHYINDVLDGPYLTMYPNGDIREKGKYSANRRVGAWIRMDETGQVTGQ
ncbi:MAG: toxin-antitoxin system YwqK family antitoxin [Bacteroidales bacterium]|nr:toxin-antitoxin system YwqK family antitoxin [Bacteroidales bacterium]